MRISDWSSDVCSSDLIVDRSIIRPRIKHADGLRSLPRKDKSNFHKTQTNRLNTNHACGPLPVQIPVAHAATRLHFDQHGTPCKAAADALHHDGVSGLDARSEERRVGKECVSTCSSRWSPYH